MISNYARGIFAATMTAAMLAAAGSAAAEEARPAKDYNQRALEIYEFRKAAQSGPERGREIYYYKCWFCHNEFVKDVPHVQGLYQKPNMLSGLPVNDANVKAKLRDGGPNMPAYKYALKDADFDDLVSFLREKCCWDSDSPPPNPRYIAK